MKFLYEKQKRGFTLIETLVSIFIFSVALVGLGTIAGRGVSGTRGAASEITAQYLTQEAIELVRHMRDSNFIRATTDAGQSWQEGFQTCTESNPCVIQYTNGRPGGSHAELDPCTSPCQMSFNPSNNFYGYSGDPTSFIRTVYFEPISAHEIQVVAKVEWIQGRVKHFTSASEILTRWQDVGAL